MTCVKAGGLHGRASSLANKIDVEFYTADRVKYLSAVAGAEQEPTFG